MARLGPPLPQPSGAYTQCPHLPGALAGFVPPARGPCTLTLGGSPGPSRGPLPKRRLDATPPAALPRRRPTRPWETPHRRVEDLVATPSRTPLQRLLEILTSQRPLEILTSQRLPSIPLDRGAAASFRGVGLSTRRRKDVHGPGGWPPRPAGTLAPTPARNARLPLPETHRHVTPTHAYPARGAGQVAQRTPTLPERGESLGEMWKCAPFCASAPQILPPNPRPTGSNPRHLPPPARDLTDAYPPRDRGAPIY